MDADKFSRIDSEQNVSPEIAYVLVGDLQDLLGEPESEVTNDWLRVILNALLGALANEIDPEDEQGYLSVVLESLPGWNSKVQKLRSEQDRLYTRLFELRSRIKNGIGYATIARTLRRDLRDWMIALEAYHRDENRLVHTAVNLEIGGSD
jgi:hypothetical protein